jgi:hypothetical protein
MSGVNDFLCCPGTILVYTNRGQVRCNSFNHTKFCFFSTVFKQFLDDCISNVIYSKKGWLVFSKSINFIILPLQSSTISSMHSCAIDSMFGIACPLSKAFLISRNLEGPSTRSEVNSGTAGMLEK